MYEDDGSPTPGLDKLALIPISCSGQEGVDGADENGCLGGEDILLDRAIMAVAVVDTVEAKDIIKATQERLDNISVEKRPCLFQQNGEPDGSELCDWDDLGLKMTLTGPVPITNSVTEFSFRLFWEIFPLAVVLVAIGLFVFHSDLLQAGISGVRPLQGIKVVIIAGLPTLCAVFWTLGIIGATNMK